MNTTGTLKVSLLFVNSNVDSPFLFIIHIFVQCWCVIGLSYFLLYIAWCEILHMTMHRQCGIASLSISPHITQILLSSSTPFTLFVITLSFTITSPCPSLYCNSHKCSYSHLNTIISLYDTFSQLVCILCVPQSNNCSRFHQCFIIRSSSITRSIYNSCPPSTLSLWLLQSSCGSVYFVKGLFGLVFWTIEDSNFQSCIIVYSTIQYVEIPHTFALLSLLHITFICHETYARHMIDIYTYLNRLIRVTILLWNMLKERYTLICEIIFLDMQTRI